MWKDIENYEGIYQVSDEGEVRKVKPGKEMIIKSRPDKDGYRIINLWKNGKTKCVKVHRLVAQAFIPNPESHPQINHKNEIRDDNRVSNLEWCTAKYNINYGTHTQRAADTIRGEKHTWEHIKKIREHSRNIPVLMCDIKGNPIQQFISASEAGRYVGGNATNITAVIKGRSKTYKGYIFKYA